MIRKRYILSERITSKTTILHFLCLLSVLAFIGLVLSDEKQYQASEPIFFHLDAFSIAVSTNNHGASGATGFTDIYYQLLDALPRYQSGDIGAMNDALTKTQNLHITHPERVHATDNDIGFVYFVIYVFKIFGANTLSLLYGWLVFFLTGILIFQLAFRRSVTMLVLLNTILFTFILSVLALPIQASALGGLRTMTLLGVVPLIALMALTLITKKTLFQWFYCVMFCLLLAATIFIRGTAQWMLLALVVLAIFLAYRKYLRKDIEGRLPKFSLAGLLVLFVPFVLVLTFSQTASKIVSRSLSNLYTEAPYTTTHVFFHSLLEPLATHSTLNDRFFCLPENLIGPANATRVNFLQPRQCGIMNQTKRASQQLVSLLSLDGRLGSPIVDALLTSFLLLTQYTADDQVSYNATERHVLETGSKQVLGVARVGHNGNNIDWKMHEAVSRDVYIAILRNYPIEALTVLVVKPLRVTRESLLYPHNALIKIYKAENRLFLLFLAGSGCLLWVLSILVWNSTRAGSLSIGTIGTMPTLRSISLNLGTVAALGLVPAIVFYPYQHTIIDYFTLIVLAVLFLIAAKFGTRDTESRDKIGE